MDNNIKVISENFSKSIAHLLELSEGMFGDHRQWRFYRKALLRELNNLKREVEDELGQEWGGQDGATEQHVR